ncbi:MAG: restriction endonuclease-like protein [Acidaminococcaceae bacterium]|nr:restriction endonuclease-like protein [Acidaminococcaceae bacterium]
MDSLRTGSDELVYIGTEKVSITIKGSATHPSFQGVEYSEGDSTLRVYCHDSFDCMLKGNTAAGTLMHSSIFSGIYSVTPMFFEQQRYEIIIEAAEGHTVQFWHDNINIRKKVTPASRFHEILSGVINFGNEIGFSDLVIQVDHSDYLRLVLEVFPSKINYWEDYHAIVEDVTQEVYNVVFDFLKRTYLDYQQNDRASSSPVEFFAVIRKIYGDFLKAADMILSQPHHILETTHRILPGYKVKILDNSGMRWIEKHPGQVLRKGNQFAIAKALAVKKQITYDTKENRLTKYILQTTASKLKNFKQNYLRLKREEDIKFVAAIDEMIKNINRRSSSSFLSNAGTYEETGSMSLVFSMAPGYRDLYKYYLMLLRGLAITGDVFNISVKDLAVLYEYWCFIKMNSLMKDKYQLVSQDIIKVQGNGLFVSLVKGKGSRVEYRNPVNGETIILSYNPKAIDVPTVSQRPDNVLTLKKKGANIEYEYVFDAKYRVNPALQGTEYYASISHLPGPEVSDINTMHRYRDAIVDDKDASTFERRMFGAYVLFPYKNEKEYESHKFYQSIRKVNIGGLPFLPSATNLVTKMLDELISDSPQSAFERATLPKGIEEKLAKVDWSTRDVLVGSMRNLKQFEICLLHKFYHIPAKEIKDSDLPIRKVALYQSLNLFGTKAGIRYYGDVISCNKVLRKEIKEIPKDTDELYYRFEIKEWNELQKPIKPKEFGFIKFFTNQFLLEHSAEIPELKLRSEEEYRLFFELKRALNNTEINDSDSDIRFHYNDSIVAFEEGNINVYKNGKLVEQKSVESFSRSPNTVFRLLQKSIAGEKVST